MKHRILFYFAALAILLAATTRPAFAQFFNRSPFPLKAQKVADLGDWTPEAVTVKGSTQGFAMSGRYGFVFHDKGQCVVYDLKKKTFVNTFKLDVDETCHCNNASFGREKFSKQSKFPLLYLSECRGSYAFLTQGYPPHPLSLYVVNLTTHETEAIVDLTPLEVEPEGLDIRGKWLYTAHHTSKKARNTILWRHALK